MHRAEKLEYQRAKILNRQTTAINSPQKCFLLLAKKIRKKQQQSDLFADVTFREVTFRKTWYLGQAAPK